MDNSVIEASVSEIRKRNGSIDNFNIDKISNALFKALAATSKPDRGLADQLAASITLCKIFRPSLLS